MTESSIELRATKVEYLSDFDETAFFQWLAKIECVETYKGSGDTLIISVRPNAVEVESLRELIALFYRYEIDMRQLLQLRNETNAAWLMNTTSYWYKQLTA